MNGIAVAMRKAQTVGHANEMVEARSHGALYHATNSEQDWFCVDCGVFGHGGSTEERQKASCWCCGSESLKAKWVPRIGQGAQHQAFGELAESSLFLRPLETI